MIVAEFLPGHMILEGISPWTLTVKRNGDAVQEFYVLRKDINKSGQEKKALQLSPKDIEDIYSRVQETDFLKLKRRYGNITTPPHGMVIEVRANGIKHCVELFDPYLTDASNKRDIASFQKVWSELLSKVPSPNNGPKAPDR
jgi:hypothetical protein